MKNEPAPKQTLACPHCGESIVLRFSDPAPFTGKYGCPHCSQASYFPRGVRLLGFVVFIAVGLIEGLVVKRLGLTRATSPGGMFLYALAFLGSVVGAAYCARFACLAATRRLVKSSPSVVTPEKHP